MKKKTLDDFEVAHGQEKLAHYKKRLEEEQAKVEQLAGIQNKISVVEKDDSVLRFGLVGDLHFGAISHYGDALNAYYEILELNGISEVYCAGDVLEGHGVYKGQMFEVRDVGFERQLDRFSKECPRRDGITNYFITGNHDDSFKKLAGVPVGKHIAAERDDWVFLGEDQAQVSFETPAGPYSLRLLHPDGGTAYAISYKPQQIVTSLSGGEKPNMLAIGHFHKAEFLPSHRNISVFQTGTFQKQTKFMARKGSAAHIGGWIVEVAVGERHNQVKAEFIAFYE